MSDSAVFYERRGRVGLVTLNRPDTRNSMSPELLDAFGLAIAEAGEDAEIRCLVVTGKGSCFSAGADLNASMQREEGDKTPQERSFAMYEPFLKVLDIEVPVVGALNGHAVGGGFGLALLADIRIANEDAKYGANFGRLGVHSGMAISYTLPRIVGAAQAAQMLYTGVLIRGRQAQAMGLCNEAIPAERVLPRAIEIAEQIAEAAPLAVRGMKASLRAGLGWEIRQAAWAEAKHQAASLQTADAQEGVAAVLAKRKPEFKGR
jgi:enoyl-CoA hydratase/carnithine racemase